MPPKGKNPKKPTTGKSKKPPHKQTLKKVIKLVPLAPKSEGQEWINRQVDKLMRADKALVITYKDGILSTGWAECSREDIVFLCQSVVHDLYMSEYIVE